jgi:alkylation response protein AidB-like acyl-CoA dehydrogenase
MHATWLTGASVIYDGDTPRRDADGQLLSRWFYFPVEECRIIDTWHVTGLCGTGSHDFAVDDIFVPHERTSPHRMGGTFGFDDPGEHEGPLYRFGIGVIGLGFAAVSLGIARGAINAFVGLITSPGGAKAQLRDNEFTQAQLGQAEAQVLAARAFLFEAIGRAWESALQTRTVPSEQQRLISLATRHATITMAQVVEALWYAAGAAALFESNPLERRFRDAHAAGQRIAPSIYGVIGRQMLDAGPRT